MNRTSMVIVLSYIGIWVGALGGVVICCPNYPVLPWMASAVVMLCILFVSLWIFKSKTLSWLSLMLFFASALGGIVAESGAPLSAPFIPAALMIVVMTVFHPSSTFT